MEDEENRDENLVATPRGQRGVMHEILKRPERR